MSFTDIVYITGNLFAINMFNTRTALSRIQHSQGLMATDFVMEHCHQVLLHNAQEKLVLGACTQGWFTVFKN